MNIFAIVNEYRVKSIPLNEHGNVTKKLPLKPAPEDRPLPAQRSCASKLKLRLGWNTFSKPRYGSGWARRIAASTERRPASS